MEENETKDRPSLVSTIRQVAEEIDYQPGVVEDVVRLARELTERDLGEWISGDDAYRLRRFLAQCLPYLSPEVDRALEELPNRIRDVAVEIRFDGSDWALLSEALNRKAIPSYSSGAWNPVDVREFCERGLRDLTQYVPEIKVPEEKETKLPTSRSAETVQGMAGYVAPQGAASFRRGTVGEFIDRIDDLLHRINVSDLELDVPLKDFFKWKMQAHWLLHRYLGPEHPYTRELVSTVGRETHAGSRSREIAAGLGILEGLKEDLETGCIVLEQRE
jgi:hypothetical protein